MARFRLLPLLVTAVFGIAAVGGCSSSSKSSTAKDTTTSVTSSGEVTVTTGSAANTVSIVVGDTKGTDGPMTLVPAAPSAKAGDITFAVKNTGTIDHEVVVLKTDTAFDKLPIGKDEADKIDEATSIGEVEDHVKAGESATFTLKAVAAGTYVLVCNIAKHYGLGMRAAFTVS